MKYIFPACSRPSFFKDPILCVTSGSLVKCYLETMAIATTEHGSLFLHGIAEKFLQLNSYM